MNKKYIKKNQMGSLESKITITTIKKFIAWAQ